MTNRILNLVNTDNSDIHYTISRFPDGQQNITLNEYQWDAGKLGSVAIIVSRFNSWLDLELIVAATSALRNWGYQNIELDIPYFLGGRSDRSFSHKGVHYIKDVVAPIINSQNYMKVHILDPHSYVIEGCINNFQETYTLPFIKWALIDINNKNGARTTTALVVPDAGAQKRVESVAREFDIRNIITASKVRELKTGNIVKTEVDLSDVPWSDTHDMVVIDDICDGGRTFIELAKVIKQAGFAGKLHLVVTHGIFSKGVSALTDYYDYVYTTDSIGGHDILPEHESTYKVFTLFDKTTITKTINQ